MVSVPDNACTLLSSHSNQTGRNSDVQTIRPIRNNICDVFGIARPKALKVYIYIHTVCTKLLLYGVHVFFDSLLQRVNSRVNLVTVTNWDIKVVR